MVCCKRSTRRAGASSSQSQEAFTGFSYFSVGYRKKKIVAKMKSVRLVNLSIAVVILLISFPSVFVVAQAKDEIETSDADREKPDAWTQFATSAPITSAPVATPKPFSSTEAPVQDVTGKPSTQQPVYISKEALKYTEMPVTEVTAPPVGIPDERRRLR